VESGIFFYIHLVPGILKIRFLNHQCILVDTFLVEIISSSIVHSSVSYSTKSDSTVGEN
jgi:hypothetical protein